MKGVKLIIVLLYTAAIHGQTGTTTTTYGFSNGDVDRPFTRINFADNSEITYHYYDDLILYRAPYDMSGIHITPPATEYNVDADSRTHYTDAFCGGGTVLDVVSRHFSSFPSFGGVWVNVIGVRGSVSNLSANQNILINPGGRIGRVSQVNASNIWIITGRRDAIPVGSTIYTTECYTDF